MALEEEIGEVKKRGATKEELGVLPVSIVEDETDMSCSICLSEFQKGECLRTLPCLHKVLFLWEFS